LYADRLLPHDLESEEAVIGSLLIDGDSLTNITSFLKSSDFYVAKNRWCYESCLALFERNEPIDQVSIAHELSQRERLEEVGGSAYLSHLVISVPTSVHIEHYAHIVQRASIMRQLITAAGDIAAIGYEGSTDTEGTLAQAEDVLFNVRTGWGTRDFIHLREILDTYMEDTATFDVSGEKSLAPIPTGFPDIDKLLGGGLQRSDMVVVAARPSLGKSTLAFNIAHYAASNGSRVGIFSLEMSAEQIAIRLLAGEANVNSHRLRIGLTNEAEDRRVLDAIGALSDLPIYIDDTPVQGIVEMRGKARRLETQRGIDLIIIDYLQLLSGSEGNRNENRVQEMGLISRSIKAMARDLDIPVLAVSQLSRAVEQRPSHRPLLSDLRESGSIEQEADVVAFIYREDQYTSREEWEQRNPNDPYPQDIAEIIFSKHRNGPTGMVPLYFKSTLVKFESLDRTETSRELV
jgi:replicative DNA helicase